MIDSKAARETDRQRIERETKEFYKRGGKVTEIEQGATNAIVTNFRNYARDDKR